MAKPAGAPALLTWIIPCRNEQPQILWTVYSIINDIPPDEQWEILIVENGSSDECKTFLNKYFNGSHKLSKLGLVRLFHNNRLGIAPALQRGVNEAYGNIVAWCCGHHVIARGTIQRLLDLTRKTGQMVKAPMLFMGDYCFDGKWKCYQYWNPLSRGWNFIRFQDTPYTVVGGGGGGTMVYKKQWNEFGGMEPNLDVYGYEIYLQNLWWLLGGQIWLEPNALKYHYTYERGYKWTMDIYRWNQIVAHYVLGGEELVEFLWKTKFYRFPEKQYQKFYDKAKTVCQESREFVLKHQKYNGFFDLLIKEPWDFPKRDWLRKTGNTKALEGYERFVGVGA